MTAAESSEAAGGSAGLEAVRGFLVEAIVGAVAGAGCERLRDFPEGIMGFRKTCCQCATSFVAHVAAVIFPVTGTWEIVQRPLI